MTTSAPTREQLLYWLHEAAEIEHNLMCCYLYAGFSLKLQDPAWSEAQAQAVQRWRDTILSVVYEEMAHLALVGNVMSALGGTPNFNRPNFPVGSGPYPAGFVIRLAPFCAATIEHFKFLERPVHEHVDEGAGFQPATGYERTVPDGRLSPGAQDYQTVGELYDLLDRALVAAASELGEPTLFVGDPSLQVDGRLAPLPGVLAVHGLSDARAAIRTIVTQGEGAGGDVADSHFSRFCRVADELQALCAADPAFAPAWQAAENPVMNAPLTAGRVHVDEPRIARWLDIGNALYTASLRCLVQGFACTSRADKAVWLGASFALMRSMTPVGQGLAMRPARAEPGAPHAGLTFTSLRTLGVLPGASAALAMAERLAQLRRRAEALPLVPVAGERASTWEGVIQLLRTQEAALRSLAGAAAPAPLEPESKAARPPVPAPAAAVTAAPERVRGRDITIVFDARRCIHSRHCVLDAPRVFKANTPGEWIFPDAMEAEAIRRVAHDCPSGAVRYEAHDGGPPEGAPEVNQLRVRENGPYALHATLQVAGADDGFRATLCRCGQSANKPWCDGSHAQAAFTATGEPPTGSTEPLAARGGLLEVQPRRNGPLEVRGNLEICSGTGRTVTRVTSARLCRCGQSKSKPFCDLSHLPAGFEADGA